MNQRNDGDPDTTILTMELLLSSDEQRELQKKTALRSKKFEVSLEYSQRGEAPNTRIIAHGKQVSQKNTDKLRAFIDGHLFFNYIKTVRTEDDINEELDRAVYNALRSLRDNDEFIKSQKTANDIINTELKKISENLLPSLRIFLPNLQSINFNGISTRGTFDRLLIRQHSDLDITVDDGCLTSLSQKGEGVKNLITIALLNQTITEDSSTVVAIEEPESHLHPGAIHNLANVLQSISRSKQLIITTHNPLFVQRGNLKSNYIVDNSEVHQAKDINKLRLNLGISASDNLLNANVAVVVEGENDEKILRELLPIYSKKIDKSIKSGQLTFRNMHGVRYLKHAIYGLKDIVCDFYILCDHDPEAQKYIQELEKSGEINSNDYVYVMWNDNRESEFEDCIRPNIYLNSLNEFLEKPNLFSTKDESGLNKYKWSNRIKKLCENKGICWDDQRECEFKAKIADYIVKNISNHSLNWLLSNIFIAKRMGFIDTLVHAIENKLT